MAIQYRVFEVQQSWVTSAEKPWFWRDILPNTKREDSGIRGCCGIDCSVVLSADSVLVVSVPGGPVTVPPGPKTTVLLASLGQLG